MGTENTGHRDQERTEAVLEPAVKHTSLKKKKKITTQKPLQAKTAHF